MSELLPALSCTDFVEQLAASVPVPGGGSVAALTGALAAALGSMAVNFTSGKKKFLSFADDHRRMLKTLEQHRRAFLKLMAADAAAFEPLSRAYSLDKSIPGNAEILRSMTLKACQAPFEIMQRSRAVILLLEELREKCSILLLSDVGCAALAARCALEAAALNVFINTRTLPGDPEAKALSEQADSIRREFVPRAQALSDAITETLNPTE